MSDPAADAGAGPEPAALADGFPIAGSPAEARRQTWLRRIAALCVWVAVIVAAQVAIQRSGKGTVVAVSDAVEAVRGAWWAAPAYLGACAARSLVLFPASVLNVAAGVLFGVAVGLPLALLGAMISAAISYELARTVGPTEATLGRPVIGRWTHRIQHAGFVTTLSMRLVMLPFDPVNLLAGGLRIPRRAFLAGTALGLLPGVTAYVLVGASVGRVDVGLSDLSVPMLVAGGLFYGFSIVLAVIITRRQAASNDRIRGPSLR